MEFDDHDDHDEEEEEMEFPGPASYDPALGNSSRGNRIGGGGDAGRGETVAAPLAAARNPASRYRECLKNHAVSMGRDAVDGCGEFMPAGEEGTLDALKCAACGCHRNFHRKESDEDPFPFRAFSSSPFYRSPVGCLHVAPHHHPPPTLALPSTSGGGGGGGHSRDDQEDVSNPSGGGGAGTPTGKKRFRTKFTQEQKDKMLTFAERLGWRIQKHDEAAVQQFCSEASIKRHVLKVWMHNNKHTLGKKP